MIMSFISYKEVTKLSLRESVRQWVLQNLPYDRGDAALAAYLNGLDAHQLLVAYHNWMNRNVQPQPRAVIKSSAFQRNLLTAQRASDLAQIVGDVESGRDLRKYLSRAVERAPVKAPGQQRPDLDLMLNDWGIHHLHISTQVEADGFVRRDNPVLFVVFRPDTAYFIDIMQHGDWTRDHVLEVIASEWPDEGILNEIKGAIPGKAYQPNETERATLRAKHINADFEYGGRVFRPAGALMSSGTTFAATLAADRLLEALRAFEQKLIDNPDWLRREFEAQGVSYPRAPEFQFAIREDGAGVIETATGTWMKLL